MTRCASLRRPGFTLIELVVVLAIIGLAASVVAPAFRRLGRDARTAVDAITTAYGAASRAATERGIPVRLVLEMESGQFALTTVPPAGIASDTVAVGAVPLAADGSTRLSGGRAGWAVVTFDAFGRGRGDRMVITQGEERYDIQVDPWTAAAVVQRR